MKKTLAAVVLMASVLTPSQAQVIVSQFPIGPAGAAFLGGLDFDCNSRVVWNADETNNIVSCYSATGKFLKSYPAVIPPGSGLTDPQPIGVGINPTTGKLWIGDEGEFVYELDPLTGLATGVSWSTLPSINDVSGVAVNPITGNIYVVQDSGTPRKIVEFTPAGAPVTTINLPATGSSLDPDGLAYDSYNNWFYVGDDTANTIYRVDTTGATLASWNLSSLNISPEGVGIDEVNGLLYIGDGFVTRQVFVVSGIATPFGNCISGPSLFYVSVTTTPGMGNVAAEIGNVPPTTVEGFTAFTLDTTLPVGAGPIFGITPDANTLAILQIAPVAQPGNPLHWTWPAVGVYPQVPLVAPPGTLSFTGTWDFLGVALDGSATLTPTFNVSRVTW
jgi:hypothetical protein